MVEPPPQLSRPLCGNGHQNPVLTRGPLLTLRLRMDCSGVREHVGHQRGKMGMILELPQMKEFPKSTFHEKGRQYLRAGPWVCEAGGPEGPARCTPNFGDRLGELLNDAR